MKNATKAILFSTLVLVLSQLLPSSAPAAGRRIDDNFLKLSFNMPDGWRVVKPDQFKFSLIETTPSYIFQKGNTVMFVLYEEAGDYGLNEASEWMHSQASDLGKTSELSYISLNGRAASRFMVRGKGSKIGALPEQGDRQTDNVIISVINDAWFIRIIYSSPDYKANLNSFDAFLHSMTFKGKTNTSDAGISDDYSGPPGYTGDSAPPDARTPARPCAANSALKIQSPMDGASTDNNETNIKVSFNDIDEIFIRLNGLEIAYLSEPENPLYRKILLEKGRNNIEVTGKNACGQQFTTAVNIVKEEKNK